MVFIIVWSNGVKVSGGKHSGYPPFRPNKRELRKLILHRAAVFVKHFIFSLKELQSPWTRDNAERDGLVGGVGQLEKRTYFFVVFFGIWLRRPCDG